MEASALKERGNAAFSAGNFPEAIRFFTKAINKAPSDHILYSNRSGAYASSKEYDLAKIDAQKCISINPKWAKGYARLGLALYYLRDLEASKDTYAKGLDLDPSNQSMAEGLAKVKADLLNAPTKPEKRKADFEDDPNPKRPNIKQETTHTTTSPLKTASSSRPTSKDITKMTKGELLDALSQDRPFKEKNEIVKRLGMFPAIKKEADIDPIVTLPDVTMKQFKTPQAFHCVRCDRAKISNMKASLKMKHNNKKGMHVSGAGDAVSQEDLCGSCYDHLTRCVIPMRNVPEYQRPEKCIHQVPRGYQKIYRTEQDFERWNMLSDKNSMDGVSMRLSEDHMNVLRVELTSREYLSTVISYLARFEGLAGIDSRNFHLFPAVSESIAAVFYVSFFDSRVMRSAESLPKIDFVESIRIIDQHTFLSEQGIFSHRTPSYPMSSAFPMLSRRVIVEGSLNRGAVSLDAVHQTVRLIGDVESFGFQGGSVVVDFFDARSAIKAVSMYGRQVTSVSPQLISSEPIAHQDYTGDLLNSLLSMRASSHESTVNQTNGHYWYTDRNSPSPFQNISNTYDMHQLQKPVTSMTEKKSRRQTQPMGNAGEDFYQVNSAMIRAGADTRTTCMIRNIPNKYTQKMLLKMIDLHFTGAYDFFYLPVDFKNRCNVGYAFINFCSCQSIPAFMSSFDNKRWERFNSDKVCKVTYARLQGRDMLLEHFKSSSIMQQHKNLRPFFRLDDYTPAVPPGYSEITSSEQSYLMEGIDNFSDTSSAFRWDDLLNDETASQTSWTGPGSTPGSRNSD